MPFTASSFFSALVFMASSLAIISALAAVKVAYYLLLVLGVSVPELIQRLREIRVHSLNLRPVLRDGLLKVAGGAFQGFDRRP